MLPSSPLFTVASFPLRLNFSFLSVVFLFKMVTRFLSTETPKQEKLQRGKLSTVDLLVVTNLDHLIFILKILFTFFYLNEEANCTERSPLVSCVKPLTPPSTRIGISPAKDAFSLLLSIS